MNKQLSKCCGANVRVIGDTTKYYQCLACGYPCNIQEPEMANSNLTPKQAFNRVKKLAKFMNQEPKKCSACGEYLAQQKFNNTIYFACLNESCSKGIKFIDKIPDEEPKNQGNTASAVAQAMVTCLEIEIEKQTGLKTYDMSNPEDLEELKKEFSNKNQDKLDWEKSVREWHFNNTIGLNFFTPVDEMLFFIKNLLQQQKQQLKDELLGKVKEISEYEFSIKEEVNNIIKSL